MTDDKSTIKRQLKELELEEKRLDVEKAKNDLEQAEINLELRHLDRIRSRHAYGLLADGARGVFRLEEAVYAEVLNLGTAMQRWGDANPGEPVTLYIFSPGGSMFHGFALYDTLRTLSTQGHTVTTVIRGFAGSMASIIFLAGDVRRIGAESYIHQHEGRTGVSGSTSAIEEEAAFMKKLEEKVTRIYTSRTKMTAAQFKAKIRKKDWYAEADEAIRLGIATERD